MERRFDRFQRVTSSRNGTPGRISRVKALGAVVMLFVTVSLLDWFMKISSTLAVCRTFALLFPYTVFSVMTAPFVRNDSMPALPLP